MLVDCSRFLVRRRGAAPTRHGRARLSPRRALAAGRGWLVGLVLALVATLPVGTVGATPLDAVLGLRAEVPSDAKTARTLGRVRQGSAVVIDNAGLALTIGYLVLEASAVSLYDAAGRTIPADVVAYDHETGFGLVRALVPLDVTPLPIAADLDIATGDPLLVVSRAGPLEGTQVTLADRRVFAGYWEYLLDDALFTTPGHGQFGGAALIDPGGRLVGIGSLRVGDAGGDGRATPGNMFVPVDLVPPILGDMLATGHAGQARPWLGITSRESPEGVVLGGVSDGGPADRAGLRPGDRVVAVGDAAVGNLETFYRSVWELGDPGVAVPLKVERGERMLDVTVRSIDRRQWLRLDQSF